MWKVLFTTSCEKQIKTHLKDGLIDEDDKKIISIWIKQVKKHGPDSLRNGKNIWYDHDLVGKGKVVRITPEHNYKAVTPKIKNFFHSQKYVAL